MKKKKVFFISSAANIHTVRWVNALTDEFEVHLIYCKGHEVGINKINEQVILHRLKYKYPLGYYLNAWELNRLFRKIRPDIINVHYASGYGTLVRMARVKPVILSVWGSDVYDFPKQSKWKRRILYKNIKSADRVASTSNKMADRLRKEFPELSKEITITPFGVDINRFNNNGVEKDKNTFKIGLIKTLMKKYGIEYAILAVSKLKKDLIKEGKLEIAQKIQFDIYGDGEEKENLQELIKKEGMEDCIHLKGKIPNKEVPNVLNQLDVFCATSILDSESFGVAVVEAMSCEVPVIVSDVDGFSEVVKNNETGIIVERMNVEETTKALHQLLDDEQLRKEMGKRARQRVIKYYNWEDNVQTMKNLYNVVSSTKEE